MKVLIETECNVNNFGDVVNVQDYDMVLIETECNVNSLEISFISGTSIVLIETECNVNEGKPDYIIGACDV